MHLDSEGQPLRWLRTDKAIAILRKLEAEKVIEFAAYKIQFRSIALTLYASRTWCSRACCSSHYSIDISCQ